MPATKKKTKKPAAPTADEIIATIKKFCEANGLGYVNTIGATWDLASVSDEKLICCNEAKIRRIQEGKRPMTAERVNLSLLHELGHIKDSEIEFGEDYEDYEWAESCIKNSLLYDLRIEYLTTGNIKASADLAANYYHLPREKRANDIMGLDFREMVYLHWGIYPSEKWQSNPANVIVNLEIPKALCRMLLRETARQDEKYKEYMKNNDCDLDTSQKALENLKNRSVKYLRFLISVYPMFMSEERLDFYLKPFQDRLEYLTKRRKKNREGANERQDTTL